MNREAADGKASRQSAILDVVAREDVATQNDLVRALKKRGISATQVSVSRDIAELGLVKASGKYRATVSAAEAPDPEMPLRVWMRGFASAGPNIVVIRCDTGTAQQVGLVVDHLAMEGVVGTIAGDDTVFVAVADAGTGRKFVDFLKSRMSST
ncbi:MAG: arginine repressor [Elusimicrobia bacterium]|nr:arginine repressor [Elusimicrobiota bacterium]